MDARERLDDREMDGKTCIGGYIEIVGNRYT